MPEGGAQDEWRLYGFENTVFVVSQWVKRSYVVLVQTVVLVLGGGVPGDLGQCSSAAEFLKQ